MSSFTRFEMTLALCIACALSAGALGQVVWERQGEEPVLPAGDPGSWDGGGTAGMCVLREPDSYKGWYTGTPALGSPPNQIGLVVSADGIEWERVGGEPVLARLPGTWEDSVYHPSVIRDDSGYQMWYSASRSTAGPCQIGHASSSDGINWLRDEEPVLATESIPWESGCTDNPRVVVVEGKYFMYYTGGPLSYQSFRSWAIGLAISEDGAHWTRYAGNPVFKLDAPDNPTGLWGSHVRYDDSARAFEMWTTVLHAPQDNGSAIGYATSADGIEWCGYADNPVLSPADGTWDYGFTIRPSVLFEDGEYRLWYAGGVQGSTIATGYAVSEWTIPRASFTAVPRAAPESSTVDFDASRSATPNRTLSSYVWDFGDGSPAVTVEGDARTSHTYAAPGHYVARLTAVDSAGKEGCVTRGVDVKGRSCELEGWTASDVGEPLFPGSACPAKGCSGQRQQGAAFAVTAAGRFLGGASDQFTFVHRQVTGDAVLNARVGGAWGAGGRWQAGVMLRESLDAGSRHLSMLVHQGSEATPRYRAVGRSSTNTSRFGTGAVLPAWVRVERHGDEFIASFSEENTDEPASWTELSRIELPGCPETLHAGIAAVGADLRSGGSFVALQAYVCDVDLSPAAPAGTDPFLRGDCNGDGSVTGEVTDAVFMLNFNFTGGTAPPCFAACDANGDGSFVGEVSDAVFLLNFNFLGGPAPPAPFPACGRSQLPGDAALGCATPAACP